MKKVIAVFLAVLLLVTVFAGCAGGQSAAPASSESAVETNDISEASESIETADSEAAEEPAESEKPAESAVVSDGRARPSSCGQLQVTGGRLCSQSGEPVMLRGVSSYELTSWESFLNDDTFRELAEDDGVNLVRLAMYTYGVGIVGYCSGGNQERCKEAIDKGVQLAADHDMYVIIDWHILSDGDPNTYADEAEIFFAEMAEKYRDCNHVLYEICNEPNGVDWASVSAYAQRIIPVIREKDPDSVIIVGNPDWSKDLYSVAADPLEFDNILYTLHFYSATHGENFRKMTKELSQRDLPIFVSEFGVTASSGGLPRDLESADTWIELLESENISYCMWNFSKVNEACAAIRWTVLKYSGFAEEDYSETGLWLLETLKKYNTR